MFFELLQNKVQEPQQFKQSGAQLRDGFIQHFDDTSPMVPVF